MIKNTSKEYINKSIIEILDKVNKHEILLPALQRKYVWDTEQIESLFDSIMQGYPIGTFLFWNINRNSIEGNYTFYDFIKNYDSRKIKNERSLITSNNVTAVLDGQQRLTSLYLSLYGSYTEKIPGKWYSNADAWQEKFLYLNLMTKSDIAEDYMYEFKFLTTKEFIENKDQKVWYKVSDIISWGQNIGNNKNREYKNIKERYKEQKLDKDKIFETLILLHKRLAKDDYLTYFNLNNMEIDEVLDIFIRVNSGGTKLTKSDLLMSTITVHWDKARDNVDELLIKTNYNERFEFDVDFIMRTALVVMDGEVLFKIKNFNSDTVNKIKNNWKNIASSILECVNLLIEFGFDEKTLTSKNAVIPIVYYIYKGGYLKDNERAQIKLYLQSALIKRFFGSHGDQKLAGIRNELKDKVTNELKNKRFDFNSVKNIVLSGNTLNITEEDIDVMLTEKKGRYAYVILSVLYPELNNANQFDQDHIHPSNNFTKKNLKSLGLNDDEVEEWIELKDQIPNLQLMSSRDNRVKQDTDLQTFIDSKVDNRSYYLHSNFIPEDMSYEFKSFKTFFDARKELLKQQLKLKFGL